MPRLRGRRDLAARDRPACPLKGLTQPGRSAAEDLKLDVEPKPIELEAGLTGVDPSVEPVELVAFANEATELLKKSGSNATTP